MPNYLVSLATIRFGIKIFVNNYISFAIFRLNLRCHRRCEFYSAIYQIIYKCNYTERMPISDLRAEPTIIQSLTVQMSLIKSNRYVLVYLIYFLFYLSSKNNFSKLKHLTYISINSKYSSKSIFKKTTQNVFKFKYIVYSIE